MANKAYLLFSKVKSGFTVLVVVVVEDVILVTIFDEVDGFDWSVRLWRVTVTYREDRSENLVAWLVEFL